MFCVNTIGKFLPPMVIERWLHILNVDLTKTERRETKSDSVFKK